ncbi:hypothetical protein HID58_003999 [Brassica napus]|uniref:Uncharacterized protein n=1 Tax=Brassica napus TaxID=3708 RepID=A0ABQ7XL02_BRANA|nr:hypothetical protein HID58_003999 [Brassica napus]
MTSRRSVFRDVQQRLEECTPRQETEEAFPKLQETQIYALSRLGDSAVSRVSVNSPRESGTVSWNLKLLLGSMSQISSSCRWRGQQIGSVPRYSNHQNLIAHFCANWYASKATWTQLLSGRCRFVDYFSIAGIISKFAEFEKASDKLGFN